MEQTTLYFREGSSDKVYQASIQPQDGGYIVHFAYGRRGSTLTAGTKTQSPVNYPKAKVIYDKLVREKTAKGYTPGESGTPYQHTDKENRATGILPQLLNAIDHEEAARLVRDPQWLMQEKFDGKRMLIRRSSQGIEGINRSGLVVALPEPIVRAVDALDAHFIVDGECLGDQLVAFDLLELNGTDCRDHPFQARFHKLIELVVEDSPHLMLAETASGTADKAAMLQRLKDANKEGVVFRHHASRYTPDRPASGGDALKLKFYETASFMVARINGRRSVGLTLLKDDRQVSAGNVTIPPNHEIPAPGDIVEVRFLYAIPESGSVYQPVYLGRREDIPRADCTTDQLKFKPTVAA
jgi:bifunctional non-homologous end joining protein LigD